MRALQFGLARLMVFMLAIAVFMALIRWWGPAGLVVSTVPLFAMWLTRRGTPFDLALVKSLIAYCVASLLTLPLLDALWFGEVPLLAIIQLPKTEFAHWLRTNVVMEAITMLGWSQGSFSPDYIAARPYALAIAYLLPLGLLLAVIWARTRMAHPYGVWACVLLMVATLDFWCTLALAGGPGLSVY
jgi:hypothetical protein